jgi:hypothetical protein
MPYIPLGERVSISGPRTCMYTFYRTLYSSVLHYEVTMECFIETMFRFVVVVPRSYNTYAYEFLILIHILRHTCTCFPFVLFIDYVIETWHIDSDTVS